MCTYVPICYLSFTLSWKNFYLILKEVLITKLVMKMINVLTRFCVLYVVKCTFMDVQQERQCGAFWAFGPPRIICQYEKFGTTFKWVYHQNAPLLQGRKPLLTFCYLLSSKPPSIFLGCTLIDISSLHLLKRPLFLRKYISLCVFESFASFITQYPQCTLKWSWTNF